MKPTKTLLLALLLINQNLTAFASGFYTQYSRQIEKLIISANDSRQSNLFFYQDDPIDQATRNSMDSLINIFEMDYPDINFVVISQYHFVNDSLQTDSLQQALQEGIKGAIHSNEYKEMIVLTFDQVHQFKSVQKDLPQIAENLMVTLGYTEGLNDVIEQPELEEKKLHRDKAKKYTMYIKDVIQMFYQVNPRYNPEDYLAVFPQNNNLYYTAFEPEFDKKKIEELKKFYKNKKNLDIVSVNQLPDTFMIPSSLKEQFFEQFSLIGISDKYRVKEKEGTFLVNEEKLDRNAAIQLNPEDKVTKIVLELKNKEDEEKNFNIATVYLINDQRFCLKRADTRFNQKDTLDGLLVGETVSLSFGLMDDLDHWIDFKGYMHWQSGPNATGPTINLPIESNLAYIRVSLYNQPFDFPVKLVSTDDPRLSTLAALMYDKISYEPGQTIELKKDPARNKNSYDLTAVNVFGQPIDKELAWSFSGKTKASQVYQPGDNMTYAGEEIWLTDGKDTITYNLRQTGQMPIAEVPGDRSFGPIQIKFDQEPEPTNKSKGACSYSSDDISFTLQIGDVYLGSQKFNIEQAKIEYTCDCKDKTKLKSAKITWRPSKPLPILDVAFFSTRATGASLAIDGEGNLSGRVDLYTELTEDKRLDKYITLKSGLKGKYNFEFAASENSGFNGHFNFTNISGINISLNQPGSDPKKPYAALTGGSINQNYKLKGTVRAMEGYKYKAKGFQCTINSLNVGAEYDLPKNEFKMLNGRGEITVDKIKGTQGKFVLDVVYKNSFSKATFKLDKFELKAYGLKINPKQLQLKFNQDLEVLSVSGEKIKASHEDINSELLVDNFRLEKGELTKLQFNGNFQYKGFNLRISDCEYKDKYLRWKSIKVSVLENNEVDVKDFWLDSLGEFGCKGLKLGIKAGCLDATCNVAIKDNLWQGSLQGNFLTAGIEGKMNFGYEPMVNKPLENFVHGSFSLALSSKNGFPIAAGVNLTKLGGMAGYNSRIIRPVSQKKFAPEYGTYFAGLSVGLGLAGGAVNLAADPVYFQFGQDTINMGMHASVSIPAKNSIFKAQGDLDYEYPTHSVIGVINSSVSFPPRKGNIFKANNNNFYFLMNKDSTLISTKEGYERPDTIKRSIKKIDLETFNPGINATIINKIHFRGGVYYRNKNSQIETEIGGLAFYKFSSKLTFDTFEPVCSFSARLEVDARAAFKSKISSAGFAENAIPVFLKVNPTGEIYLFKNHYKITGDFTGSGELVLTPETGYIKAKVKADIKYYKEKIDKTEEREEDEIKFENELIDYKLY